MDQRQLFSPLAAGYARWRPGYPLRLFDLLAAAAARGPAGRLRCWDCGTGSGQAAVGAAAHCDEVVASDPSLPQLANASLHPRVRYLAAAERCPLPDASVELVIVAQALHWLDLDLFYRQAERVLAPGGLLAVWCYLPPSVGPAVDRVTARYYHAIVGPFWPPRRALVEGGYATLPFPFPELAPPAPPLELAEEWPLERWLGYLGTWSASRHCGEARGIDPVSLVADEMAVAWGAGHRTVRWPLALRWGRRPAGPGA